jgi:hypothetical protein
VINKHNAAARLGKAVSDGATCTSESLAPQMKRPVLFASLQTICRPSTPMGSALCKGFGCCCSGTPRLPPTPELPVPSGKTRMCIAGWNASPNAGLAHEVASAVAKKYPDKYESWFHWDQQGPCPPCCCNNNYDKYIIERTAHETFPPELEGKASHHSLKCHKETRLPLSITPPHYAANASTEKDTTPSLINPHHLFEPVTLIRHAGHGSSPFCWLSRLEGGKNTFEPLGGRTEFCAWVTKTVRDV